MILEYSEVGSRGFGKVRLQTQGSVGSGSRTFAEVRSRSPIRQGVLRFVELAEVR